MMFEHQQALENGFLVEYANTLGLDISQFLRHMSQHTHADRVHEDFLSGMQSGVNATPTFFINGVRHDTPWGLETLLAAMEEVVSS